MNKLYYGDNLEVLREHIPSESIDLIYLDPPFNSAKSYNVLFKEKSGNEAQAQIEAFDDTWTWSHDAEALFAELMQGGASNKVKDALEALRKLLGDNDVLAYLVMMTARLVELHRVLKSSGSLVLHCDPTASHYLKVILDAIFGADRFLNEIIWRRAAVKGDARNRFGRNHDVLLFYAAGSNPTFNRLTSEHGPEYRARFRFDDGDGRGPYRDGPLDSPSPRPNLTYVYKGYPPPKNGWRVSIEEMERLDAENRLMFPKKSDARIARKLYLQEQPGVPMGDVWSDIPPINSQAAERLGYPTQKPLSLLERVVSAASNPGDLVLDPFAGCGTAIDAAQKLGRRWAGIDVTTLAVDLIDARLRHTYGEAIRETYEILGIPRDLAGAQALFKRSPFEFERWCVMTIDGQPNDKQVADKGIDGVIRFPIDAKGNSDRVLVSVKGGATNPSHVRDLVGTVQSQRAAMGVFICMQKPTKAMVEAANHSGLYAHPGNNQKYPKVQLITVQELLDDKRPTLPPVLLPYFQAQPRVKKSEQGTLNFFGA
ncbi:DNA methyltransferase [Micromonospora carbonacea]|uniref:DNA methyltransferase n=1 Tax=Micromonospora carbonacea TaxID=47853 RepID=UPI001C407F8C|nr:DNA methyltransferase [Micromonospora carbonacea]